MNNLTDAELQKLIELERMATSGPWKYMYGGEPCQIGLPKHSGNRMWIDLNSYTGEDGHCHDARFIAAVRNAAPSLLQEIVQLRKALGVAKEALYAQETKLNFIE